MFIQTKIIIIFCRSCWKRIVVKSLNELEIQKVNSARFSFMTTVANVFFTKYQIKTWRSCKKLFYKKNLDLRMAERYKQSNPNLIPVCKKRAFNFNISISLICSKCEVFSKRNFTQCLFIVEYYLNINKKCNRVKSEIFEHCFLANNVKLFIKVSGELFPEKNCNPG